MRSMCEPHRQNDATDSHVAARRRLRESAGTPRGSHDEVIAITRRTGVLSQSECHALLHEYPRTPVAKSLTADNPITRAPAVIDSRLKKRRWRQLVEGPDEHPLVRLFLAIRSGAEGIEISNHAA
jgi:hypothetical protein